MIFKNNASKAHNKSRIFPSIVSILFVLGRPVKAKEFAATLNKEEKEIKQTIKQNAHKLQELGLNILNYKGEYQLVSDKKYAEAIQTFLNLKPNKGMGKAGIEVASIICYKPGLKREQVDLIRGVNSYYTLRDLMVKGLIQEKKEDGVNRLYPSIKLFEALGIKTPEELDDFSKINNNEMIEDLIKG